VIKLDQLRCQADDYTNHLSFLNFCKIPRKRANFAARLEIPRPAENCRPYRSWTVYRIFCYRM